jgi:hypothetical protein
MIIPIDLIYKSMRGDAAAEGGRGVVKGELRVCWVGGLGYRP